MRNHIRADTHIDTCERPHASVGGYVLNETAAYGESTQKLAETASRVKSSSRTCGQWRPHARAVHFCRTVLREKKLEDGVPQATVTLDRVLNGPRLCILTPKGVIPNFTVFAYWPLGADRRCSPQPALKASWTATDLTIAKAERTSCLVTWSYTRVFPVTTRGKALTDYWGCKREENSCPKQRCRGCHGHPAKMTKARREGYCQAH